MSWFLKYRPKQIKDLDLTDVRETFLRMMDSGKIPQTLLFAGPRGTGKTSTSRILGAMLNDPTNEDLVEAVFFDKQEPDGQLQEPDPDSDFAQQVYQGQSYVVQEMDAASNRGIDDIRALKERITLPPQQGKMSVYILDEVHMLTNEAFNALLKILEEPPPHVVFILATTELHKVPPTIVSRCSTISFHKASAQELVSRQKKVLKQEEVKFETEALQQIAARADGSFRDAVKLAELAAQAGAVTIDNLAAVIGGSAEARVEKLVQAVLAKNEQQVGQVFQQLRQENYDQDHFYQTLFRTLHTNLMQAYQVEPGEPTIKAKIAFFLLKQLSKTDLKVSTPIAFLPLELKLLELIERAKQQQDGDEGGGEPEQAENQKKDLNGQNSRQTASQSAKQAFNPELNQEQATQQADQQQKEDVILTDDRQHNLSHKQNPLQKKQKKQEPESQQTEQGASLSQAVCARWNELLSAVERKNSSVAALLRSGEPESGANGTAKVKVYYRFHQEQLQQPKFKTLIENCSQELLGRIVQFKFILANPPQSAELVEVPAKTTQLEALAEEALM
jgi:DNA polymerase III subunit gamma/tau